jgi:3-methyladenine DNA glycosylase AlkD
MTLKQAMKALEAAGSAQIRAIYSRHGAGENQFGVKFADLGKIRKQIGTDLKLAAELWATGNSDARMLACMVADAKMLSADTLQAWVESIGYSGLALVFAQQLAGKSPHRKELMLRWIEAPGEYVAQAGWDLLAQMAMNDKATPDEFFMPYVERIEREIHTERNRVRYAMNSALIAIGTRSEVLRGPAVAAARRIGTVVVDHGETGCKTPAAEDYIQKTFEYKARRAAR